MASPANLSDAELLDLLRQGDHRAFTAIYKRYWKKLLHFALQKTGDSGEAENLVQDVFVSLWKRQAELPAAIELAAYLIASVKYRIIKLFHQKQKKLLQSVALDAAGDLADDSTRQYLDVAYLEEALAHLVHRLPEKAQLIYNLEKAGQHTRREIGEELGMTEKAVNTQILRLRKTLSTGLNSFLHGFLL